MRYHLSIISTLEQYFKRIEIIDVIYFLLEIQSLSTQPSNAESQH